MKRVEFRKLKMYEKLNYIKEAVLKGENKTTISLMIDECLYKTGEYMKGTTLRTEKFTKDELDVMRKKERKKMKTEPIRRIRWNKDAIKTEARKRYEESVA